MKIAGIGSRKAPESVCKQLSTITHRLVLKGHRIVSGNAEGADFACQSGAHFALLENNIYTPNKANEIILPVRGFNQARLSHLMTGDYKLASNSSHYDQAIKIAREIHAIGNNLKGFALKAHARNVFQIFGFEMDDKVDMVICWTPDGAQHYSEVTKDTGGTGTAIILASKDDIPVLNIANEHSLQQVANFLNRME